MGNRASLQRRNEAAFSEGRYGRMPSDMDPPPKTCGICSKLVPADEAIYDKENCRWECPRCHYGDE